jgi:acyl-CoA synthetase (AMP-forming)/AMP-acid ligase II
MRTADTTFEQASTMTVPELFDARVAETPSALAMRTVQGQMTFGEWAARSAGLADALTELLGALRGERIAIWMTNDEATTYVCALQATFDVAGVAVSLDDRSAVPEALRIFREAEPRAVLIGPQVTERLGADGLRELGLPSGPPSAGGWDLLLAPVADGAIAGEAVAWSAATGSGTRTPRGVAQPEDNALIAYTSGSTGTPKGAVWTQSSICQYAERVAHATYAVPRDGAPLCESDVLQSPIPLYTAASLIENLYPMVLSGCTLVYEGRRFDATASEERMATFGTTIYNGVPPHFALMCELPDRRPEAAPQLMVTSGSAITADLYRRMRARWPSTSIANWYGLNESGPGQTLNHGADMDRAPSAIGRPLPPTEVLVVDGDGNPVGTGVQGELLMRAPGQMREYFRNPEQTALRFRDGWLVTGDHAIMDADGVLHVVGRNEDRINRGGFKFYPAELESTLEEHEAVREAAVVAVPHTVLGHDAVAFVVPVDPQYADEDALRTHCRSQLAANKVPARVLFVDEFPRGAYGKVVRRELLARYEAMSATA